MYILTSFLVLLAILFSIAYALITDPLDIRIIAETLSAILLVVALAVQKGGSNGK